jgi:hypothetical protein
MNLARPQAPRSQPQALEGLSSPDSPCCPPSGSVPSRAIVCGLLHGHCSSHLHRTAWHGSHAPRHPGSPWPPAPAPWQPSMAGCTPALGLLVATGEPHNPAGESKALDGLFFLLGQPQEVGSLTADHPHRHSDLALSITRPTAYLAAATTHLANSNAMCRGLPAIDGPNGREICPEWEALHDSLGALW